MLIGYPTNLQQIFLKWK